MNIKNLITEITEVPSVWVFEHYLKDKLPRKLTGQNEMIRSIFNGKDTVPSMSIYTKGSQYKWHDFSIGQGGSKVDLVMKIEGLDYSRACTKIVNDYNEFILNGSNPISEFRQHAKYKISSWTRRKWFLSDKKYWSPYEISSADLEYFNVFPLSEYVFSKGTRDVAIQGQMIYGYFTSLGEIYKIYQPMALERRFIKIMSYVQGMDQIKPSELLIITKALKDIIALYTMGYVSIAPSSESSNLPLDCIEYIKSHYKRIICIFDNDAAGVSGMSKYLDKWEIPGVILPLSKDVSDSIKDYGSEKVKQELIKLLK